MATSNYLGRAEVTHGRKRTGSLGTASHVSRPSVGLIWALTDFVVATAAVLCAMYIRTHLHSPYGSGALLVWLRDAVLYQSLGIFLIYPIYIVSTANFFALYRGIGDRSVLNEQRMTLQAIATASLMLCGTLYVTRAMFASRMVVGLTMMITMVGAMSARVISRKLHERRCLLGLETRNVLIVGDGQVGRALRNHLIALPRLGFRFKGFISLDAETVAPKVEAEIIGNVHNCVAVARSLFVDEIYFSTPADRNTVIRVIEEARQFGIEVRVVPDLYDGLAWNAPVEYVGQFPTIPLHHGTFRMPYSF